MSRLRDFIKCQEFESPKGPLLSFSWKYREDWMDLPSNLEGSFQTLQEELEFRVPFLLEEKDQVGWLGVQGKRVYSVKGGCKVLDFQIEAS
eukprot:Gb_07448 [translate_table: standard]